MEGRLQLNPLLCGEPFAEHDGELRLGGGPFAWRHLPHSRPTSRNTRNNSLVAASSLGKWPRLRTAVRNLLLTLSMALVV